jgi:TetR/AcrR family transcriptional repressor of nem operon
MCGIHSMLTETDSFSETLQSAVFQLVESELRIIEHIFKNDLDENISMITKVSNYELALMVNSTIKGALLMNRLSKKYL